VTPAVAYSTRIKFSVEPAPAKSWCGIVRKAQQIKIGGKAE